MNLLGLLAGALKLFNALTDWLRQANERRTGRALQRGEQAEAALKQAREANEIEERNRKLSDAERRERLHDWTRDTDA